VLLLLPTYSVVAAVAGDEIVEAVSVEIGNVVTTRNIDPTGHLLESPFPQSLLRKKSQPYPEGTDREEI
jgi:hypothetical protein